MTHRNDLVPQGGAPVTPSDSAFVSFCGLYVGGAGHVALTGGDGADVTFSAVPGGTILPIRIIRVKAAGTTATSLVGLSA
jgi:hypothetical protein